MLVWSYGGGVQTAALAVLIREGALPRPDLTVIADTGREKSSTWTYLDRVMRPYLQAVGIEVEAASHSLATVDLFAKNGDLLLPAYTDKGKLPTYCSGEWKRDVVARYVRPRADKWPLPGSEVEMWLGISFDERHRCKHSKHHWIHHSFPLVERFLSRAGCYLLVEKAGLPEPPKSACWMCPHHRRKDWVAMRTHLPEDFAKAVQLDGEIRDALDHGVAYLYEGRKPLKMADLDHDPDGLSLFPECSTGYCFT